MDPEIPLQWFVIVITMTAVGAVALFGIIWLLCWLVGLSIVVVLRAWKAGHPISPNEEID